MPDAGIISTSRRAFCAGAGALMLARGSLLHALDAASTATAIRPDVAAIDHDRILTAATAALTAKPEPVTTLPCPRSPGSPHDYYSEAEGEQGMITVSEAARRTGPPAFTAHRDAIFSLGERVSALTAAYVLTNDAKFAQRAAGELRAWFVDPATSMTPRLDYAHVVLAASRPATAQYAAAPQKAPMTIGAEMAAMEAAEVRSASRRDSPAASGSNAQAATPASAPTETASTASPAHPSPVRNGSYEGILETLPLVEVAQAIPFLAASGALSPADMQAIDTWFAAYLHWLTEEQIHGPRLPQLARDHKDHHATSWLLQVSAYTLLTVPGGGAPRAEAMPLDDLRHRFHSVMLRSQVSPDGSFRHELELPNAYRDSLFNLDLMAAICQLLTTRFDSVWEYQLEDGPGMRGAIAFHFPLIADRSQWPYKADQAHFTELPGRRSSLLLAARAYQRPEYAALWKTLPADPPDAEIRRTMPVRQPLLWVRQPAHAG